MMKEKKVYDLEERTYQFAYECRFFVNGLKKTLNNIEDGKQLIKASGSVGANYIEANEKLGNRDLVLRLKIARKEAKEAHYWLRLLNDINQTDTDKAQKLIQEAVELRKILSAMINRIGIN